MKPRILVVSSAYTDFIIKTDRIPISGQSIIGDRYDYLPGGKGVYSALTFASLGAECIFCAKLGGDPHGARLRAYIESRGMDARFMTVDRQSQTGLNAVIQESGGPGRSIVYPGANRRLRADDVEEAFTAYPDALYLQFDMPPAAAVAATDFARRQDVPAFVDASGAGVAGRGFPLEQLEPTEIFILDEGAVFAFTGITPSDSEKCMRACLALSQRVNARYTVIKLGTRGLFLYDGTYFKIIAPYDAPTVDPSAAGDAFSAALTLEYLRSHDIKRACEFANIVGALVTSKPGATASIPTLEEIDEFVTRNEIEFKL